jgi:hypothetical protein
MSRGDWSCEELVWKGNSSSSLRRRAVMMMFEGSNEEEEKLSYNVVETIPFLYPCSIFIKMKEFGDFQFLRHCASFG